MAKLVQTNFITDPISDRVIEIRRNRACTIACGVLARVIVAAAIVVAGVLYSRE